MTTLRYYEKRGLLLASRRTSGGYREYNIENLRRIEAVIGAKRLGFTLEEIVQLLKAADDPDQYDTLIVLFEARLSGIRKEGENLSKIEREISDRLDEWNSQQPSKRDSFRLITGG